MCSSPGSHLSVNQKQAACSMILIVPVMLHAVVHHYPQLAMKCHYLLGATRLGLISYHVWMRWSKCLWCLVAAVALWIFLSLVSLADPLRRCWGNSWPSVVISWHHELLGMDVTVPSGWKVKPSQYVYLWLPQAGLRIASQLLLFHVSSWEDTLGANDTGALSSELVHLPSQHAQIHASEQSASQEDTLSEAENLILDNALRRSAEQGWEWRQVETKRDAVIHTTSQRHVSRSKPSLNTVMGHRTLRVLARPQSSALAAALYNAEHLHSV